MGVDTESGDVQWEHHLTEQDAQFLSGIWAYDNRTCVGIAWDVVVVIDPATGEVQTHYSSFATTTTGGTVSGSKYIDADDGIAVWDNSIDGRSHIQPVYDTTVIAVRTGTGSVYAHERSTGARRWETSVDEQVADMTLSTEYVWVLSESGGLLGLNRTDGAIFHRFVRDCLVAA